MIRQLAPGEPLPETPPRCYRSGQGYIRLRWHLGGGEYVEVYEHRVVAEKMLGRPLRDDERVHHQNHDRGDNRPENLEVLTVGEHHRLHGDETRADDERACALYRDGHTTTEVGAALGIDPATVSRILARNGVPTRPNSGCYQRVEVDEDELHRLHGEGIRVPGIARELGVGEGSVRRAMRDLGLPSFPGGRARKIHANPERAYELGLLRRSTS